MNDDSMINLVCRNPIVWQAVKERADRGYSIRSRILISDGYPPGISAMIIQFACPPQVIELPLPAFRVLFYQSTLDVISIADPYVIGHVETLPYVFDWPPLKGELPFVLAVPLPRSFPVDEHQVQAFRRAEEEWANARGIDIVGIRAEVMKEK